MRESTIWSAPFTVSRFCSEKYLQAMHATDKASGSIQKGQTQKTIPGKQTSFNQNQEFEANPVKESIRNQCQDSCMNRQY